MSHHHKTDAAIVQLYDTNERKIQGLDVSLDDFKPTTTAERVDTLISDMRDLVQATERFHADNAQEHHNICGRLEQIENVLHSISARLNIVLSDPRFNRQDKP
jgi:hypothetical protein